MWWSSKKEPGVYERVSVLQLDTIEKAPSCSEGLAIGFSREEKIVTDDDIKKLLTKCVITKCSHGHGELFSSYLHDITFRFILNLKTLRDAKPPISIDPHHTRLLFSHKWP